METSGLKKFISENDIEERKRIRQELWEKVRNADDPIVKPEDIYDPKSLYERLKEQKDKEDEEYGEKKKFKNQIRGLEKEESDFLSRVSDIQEEIEKTIQREEEAELASFRKFVHEAVDRYAKKVDDTEATTSTNAPPNPRSAPNSSDPISRPVTRLAPISHQKKILAGAIVKRKSVGDNGPTRAEKRDISDVANGVGNSMAGSDIPKDRVVTYPSATVKSNVLLPSLLSTLQQYTEDDDSQNSEDNGNGNGDHNGPVAMARRLEHESPPRHSPKELYAVNGRGKKADIIPDKSYLKSNHPLLPLDPGFVSSSSSNSSTTSLDDVSEEE